MSAHFSIILPVYNAENTLAETLESISVQSYPHFEVICVNDGSTDQSDKIALQWKEANPEIDFTLIHQSNGGLGNARNRGIAAAKNAWIAFIDADDVWLPDKLKTVSGYISNNQADVIFHSFTTFGGNQSRTRNVFDIRTIHDLLIKGNPIMPSATVVRTALLLEFPFSENAALHGAEDLDLWMRLLHANKTFHHLNAPLALYRETGGMSTRIPEHLEHVFYVISKYHKQEWFDNSVYEKAIHRKNWEAGRFFHKDEKFAEAEQYYAKARPRSPKQKAIRLLAKLKIRC